MSTDAYDQVLIRFRQLTPAEQQRMLDELAATLAQSTRESGDRSILELRGLGKEIWHDVDASEYVRKERSSWGG